MRSSLKGRLEPGTVVEEAPDHPVAGDCVVRCVHEPSPHEARYFWLGPDGDSALELRAPREPTLTVSWLLLCGKCFKKHGSTLADDLGNHEVELGEFGRWPAGLHVEFPALPKKETH